MPIRVVCTQCQTALEVSDEAAGRKGRCPACQGLMDIPPAGNGAIVVTCAECRAQLEVAAGFAGKMGRCPACQAVMPIPGTPEPASEPDPPQAREEPELVAKPSVPLTTTRYVPYEEERPRPQPVEQPAANFAPLKTVDEEALLQLPPSEPPATLIEIPPPISFAEIEMAVRAAKPPPPKVRRNQPQPAEMPPSATPAPSDSTTELPPKKKLPPVLIPPPGPPPANEGPAR